MYPPLALAVLAGCASPPTPPSVVLVSLDTLRADRLGALGHPGGLTPNLDRFAAEAVVFERAYAQANETLFSHASLLTGRYPSELGHLDYGLSLPSETPTLAEILGAYGYRTGASVGGGHLLPRFGIDRGFETWIRELDWGSLHHALPPAMAWADTVSAQEPAFLFLHGYDAHARYLKPQPWGTWDLEPTWRGPARETARDPVGTLGVFGDFVFPQDVLHAGFDWREPRVWGLENRERMRHLGERSCPRCRRLDAADHAYLGGAYDGAVRWADLWFGLAMAGLESRGWLDRSVVVVLSDHGEQLWEEGVYNHRYDLDDVTLHSVLMIRLPGGRGGGRRVAEPVALLDVLPTVLDLVGAAPPARLSGQSLAPALRGGPAPTRPAVFSESPLRMVSARATDLRLTFHGMSADAPGLADLMEAVPLDGAAWLAEPLAPRAAFEPLRGHLVAWRRALPPSPASTAPPDPEVMRELRAHGYWGVE